MALASALSVGQRVSYAGNWEFEGTITEINHAHDLRRRPDIHVEADDGTVKSFDAHDLEVC